MLLGTHNGPSTSQAASSWGLITTQGSRHTTIFHMQTRKLRLTKLKVTTKITASKLWSWGLNPVTAHTSPASRQTRNSPLDYFF